MYVYALTKIIHQNNLSHNLGLVVNMTENDKQGESVSTTLNSVMQRFLSGKIDLLGIIPSSEQVNTALKMRMPFISIWEKDPISMRFLKIAHTLASRYSNSEHRTLDTDSLLKGLINI